MSHAIEDAKKLLEEVRVALKEPSQTRGAHALLLLPGIEKTLDELIQWSEFLTTKDVEALAPRQELKSSIKELRERVWMINSEIAKMTGFPVQENVGTAILMKPLNRALKAMDLIESLMNLKSEKP